MPIMQFVGNLGYVMVALLGGVFVIKGSIEVGDIQSFFQYIRNFTQPIQQIAQVTNLLQSSAAASERVFEFLDEEEEVQQPENPDSIEGLNGNVQFEHVEFGYNPDKIIVHDFSADVHDGQKVAIVGPTGAGKTTMVKLLMRFYDVNKGAIKVDGHDIRNFNRSELQKCSEWFFRTPGFSQERSWKTSVTDVWMQPMKKLLQRQRLLISITSSCSSLADTRWYWMRRQAISLRDRNSSYHCKSNSCRQQDPDP